MQIINEWGAQSELMIITYEGTDYVLDGSSASVASGPVSLSNLVISFLIKGWSSLCKKTPGGIAPRVDPSLANSLAVSLRPRSMCPYSSPSKLFSSFLISWQ